MLDSPGGEIRFTEVQYGLQTYHAWSQYNLLIFDEDASGRLTAYAACAIETVGSPLQPTLTASMLAGWAEDELRELRTELRPLVSHVLGMFALLGFE
jgi:hypothetical protein